MKRLATDVAVVGAGPAGIAAATAAARAGAAVDVLDAGFAPGGQYWMQGVEPSPQSREGSTAIAAARSAGVRFHAGTEIWAAFPEQSLCANKDGEAVEVKARAIVVATGAQDQVMPFPGWTLPGVMTPGAGQRLAKLAKTRPGRRSVLAGSGPFLLAVAKTLAAQGVAPVAMIEARRSLAGSMAHLGRHPERWREAAGLLAALRAIPDRRRGWMVVEALGDTHLQAVRIAPVVDGAPAVDRSDVIADVDALMVGWGFRPTVEITALLRCSHAYDRAAGGWYCVADPATGATSVAQVYAAGEITGTAGAWPARAAGTIAGLSAAAAAGFTPSWLEGERRAAFAGSHRARAFAKGLNRLYEPPERLAETMRPETIVCRCEEIARRDITAAIEAGAGTVQGIKRWTRAGMGLCQGRTCGWAVAELAAAAGMSAERAGFNAPRIPLRPVPLTTVLDATRGLAADAFASP